MSPTWTEQELILVYDLFLRSGRRTLSPRNKEVQALSAYLRALPWHDDHSETFRNAAGTATKLRQLKSYEEELEPVGMSIHRGAQALARRYRDQPQEVHRLAAAIRADVTARLAPPLPDDHAATEGARHLVVHEQVERDRGLVDRKLSHVRAATGQLACEVCGFDFERTYGALGRDFAECHHLLPLGSGGPRETRLEDLAVVCANCHRMLHRRSPPLSVADLRARLVRP